MPAGATHNTGMPAGATRDTGVLMDAPHKDGKPVGASALAAAAAAAAAPSARARMHRYGGLHTEDSAEAVLPPSPPLCQGAVATAGGSNTRWWVQSALTGGSCGTRRWVRNTMVGFLWCASSLSPFQRLRLEAHQRAPTQAQCIRPACWCHSRLLSKQTESSRSLTGRRRRAREWQCQFVPDQRQCTRYLKRDSKIRESLGGVHASRRLKQEYAVDGHHRQTMSLEKSGRGA